MKRKRYLWKLARREIQLGDRTLIMGVINVTPDSFSDGGKYAEPDLAYARALELEDQGADIIDIGAESTRPGSRRVSEQEELQRLVPVLKKLRNKLAAPISVDTYKSAVAEKALELGAEIINDPGALTMDPQLAKTVVRYDAGLILNHMRGSPESWASLGPLPDVMATVYRDLEAAVRRAVLAGVDKTRIIIDPGIGFGKRGDQNFEILARLRELEALDLPVLVGPSRKSFLGQKTEEGKLAATAAAVTASILAGAYITRVHDVVEARAVVHVADGILAAADQRSRVKAPPPNPQRPIASGVVRRPQSPPARRPEDGPRRQDGPWRKDSPARQEGPRREEGPRQHEGAPRRQEGFRRHEEAPRREEGTRPRRGGPRREEGPRRHQEGPRPPRGGPYQRKGPASGQDRFRKGPRDDKRPPYRGGRQDSRFPRKPKPGDGDKHE